ncbi:MAG: hypothetical protein KatS3mg022_0302 [Armatimonadota bacterium]|nr:MAG: hypothetical protein KatS3mg022_0302 [Armatimonadota bacterium]
MDEQFALFHEEQRFTQWWFWLLILVCISPTWYIWWRYLLVRRTSGADVVADWVVWLVWLGVGVVLPVLFASMRLVTQVRHDGVYIRFVPFHWRWVRIPAEQIQEVRARTYNALLEYGGWGIRYGVQGKAYIVSGNRGVDLELANGRTLLIGSQRAEELEKAIQAIL